jgi:hypothetical protein
MTGAVRTDRRSRRSTTELARSRRSACRDRGCER